MTTEGETNAGLSLPEQRAIWAAETAAHIARRQAIITGAADWQDAGRRMHAAGELSTFTAAALGLLP